MGITGTVEDWQKAIWSDECISRIGPTRQRVLYPICVTVSQRSNVPPTSIPTKHQQNHIPTTHLPDLNPIENLWRDLKNRFYLKWRELRSSPSASQASVETYKAMCWEETDWGYIQTLMESMLCRCN